MEMELRRVDQTDDRTLGQLFVDGWFECFTCEDAVRAVKVPGRTAIPAGRYEVRLTFSQRFQRVLPLVVNVPGFSGIRIHPGNTAEDTEGCILVGTVRGSNAVLNSRMAMTPLQKKIDQAIVRGELAWITVRNATLQPQIQTLSA